jgi:hypothetical protein
MFERVLSNVRVTQADMTALQARANAANIGGKPYSFGPHGTWKIELERLRLECLKKLQILSNLLPSTYYNFNPYQIGAVVSGPWPFYLLDQFNSLSGRGFTIGYGPTGSDSIVGQAIEYDEVEYIFPESSGATASIEIVLAEKIANGLFSYYIKVHKEFFETGNFSDTATFEVHIRTGGLTGRLQGTLLFQFAASANVQLFGNSGATLEFLPGGGCLAHIDLQTADIELVCGIRKVSGPGFVGVAYSQQTANDGLKWSYALTTPDSADGIHRTKNISKFTFPNALASSSTGANEVKLLNLGALVPGTPLNGFKQESNPNVYNQVKWYGNQALIRYVPSTAIKTTGIWKAKSVPITGLSFGEGILNHLATQPTIATEDVPAISTATEYQIPAYYYHRDTEIRDPIIEARKASYGSVITEVYVRRQPILDGDYYFPDTSEAVSVEIGYIRNGSFVAFQTVTIPAGSADVYIYPFWPIFTKDYLVYRSDNPMLVHARVIAPIAGGVTAGRGATVNYPILTDHYNSTMAMLEGIVS